MGRTALAQRGALVPTDIVGTAVVSRDATVAVIEMPDGLQFTGVSKRAPGDPYSTTVALDVAYGRALQQAGQFYETRGLATSDVICTHQKEQ